MKDLIKEVAPLIANEIDFTKADRFKAALVDLIITRGLEELSKRAEAVAYQHRDGMLSCRLPGGGVPGIDWTPLFSFPPIHDIEAIENRVAEACAKFVSQGAIDLADEHGYDDMGALVFGSGPHAEAKFDRYNELMELDEAIRSGEWRKYK